MKRGGIFYLSLALVVYPASVNSGALEFNQSDEVEIRRFGGERVDVGQGLAAGGDTDAATARAAEAAVNFLLPSVGDDAPEWLKRIEFEWRLGKNEKPEFSLLTVQPLYQSDNGVNTVFTQLSQRRYDQLGDIRDVSNVGIGYRRLFMDNRILLGVNGFFDYDWEYHHQRVGGGAEMRWSGLDLRTNIYRGLTGARSVSIGTDEKILDGHDFELGLQVPYLTWARLYARRYWWDTDPTVDDIRGWRLAMELDIHPNIQFETVVSDDNANDRQVRAQIRFNLAATKRKPAMLSANPIDSVAWRTQDMRDHALDRVRRENRIIVERVVSGSVTFGRGT